ncbi:hypothetical protein [Endozoicomonas montiporae]|uniref:Prephenate dehydrogenase n=1 Tax=Endozoicomonas montiporae CL-33 TaxID=570277 RepID=A0A142BD64_9GAMM|nr:hypothetical protein [Endozoicomonas montiporae]AMO56690.1 hypothetical protein EZMO1_2618 [Endozoicomonas montiporae CL-33]
MTTKTKAQALQEKLNESLKEIYTLALRADEQIEQYKNDDQGKFSAIFQKDSGFNVHADHFLPYLIEVSEDVQALDDVNEDELTAKLQPILNKIQLMSQVLQQFHAIA